ncbi:hypothetical protein B0H16DRAFT_1453309 [Mycena metata]|uniref:Uncharacterized protein n=1 Tax=Mycena metata TaxID=1033252 RepID=A0AAD7JPH2_9AGAR|nr:hypothetical protein B0H16DRAFT_1453309 [Mycena metata]
MKTARVYVRSPGTTYVGGQACTGMSPAAAEMRASNIGGGSALGEGRELDVLGRGVWHTASILAFHCNDVETRRTGFDSPRPNVTQVSTIARPTDSPRSSFHDDDLERGLGFSASLPKKLDTDSSMSRIQAVSLLSGSSNSVSWFYSSIGLGGQPEDLGIRVDFGLRPASARPRSALYPAIDSEGNRPNKEKETNQMQTLSRI